MNTSSSTNKNTPVYFASANGKRGFFSLYGEIFNEKDHKKVYILKGGPGTGKSTLLKAVAKRAENEGLAAELFLCSTDPSSLDGVRIPSLGISVIDGTSPHSREPLLPGVSGEIVNLGEGWNSEELYRHRHKIEVLNAQKSKEYERAYRFLSAAGAADDDVIYGISSAIDENKLKSIVKRMLSRITAGSKVKGRHERRFAAAYSTAGAVALDTPERVSSHIIKVGYHYGAGVHFMNELCRTAISADTPLTIIPNALSPENVDALLFSAADMSVIIERDRENEKDCDAFVNSKRFTDPEALSMIRGKLRFSAKIRESLIGEAVSTLKAAGKVHGELEKIYGGAMNFEVATRQTAELINRIFS